MEICKAGRITTQKAECDNLKIVKIDMNLRRRVMRPLYPDVLRDVYW